MPHDGCLQSFSVAKGFPFATAAIGEADGRKPPHLQPFTHAPIFPDAEEIGFERSCDPRLAMVRAAVDRGSGHYWAQSANDLLAQ